jgi:transposase
MSWLNKRLGLSHGKIRQLFAELFGVQISRATSARSCHRTARRCQAAAEQVKRDVRGSPQVTPDETGWRVGGGKAWLHAFAAPQATCYVIDPTRSGQPAEDLLGRDWSGHLVHDGWSVYDRFGEAVHQQCTAHLINRCNELLETATPALARFPRAVKKLLQRGLRLRDRFATGDVSLQGLRVMAGRLTNRLLGLVGRRKTHPANERLAHFLFQHHDAIFNYLRHPGLDATNWRGEQAIRPAVVNRKVWGGNRTWTGATTQATLMSVMQTCLQRSLSPVRFLIQALTAPTANLLIPVAAR